MTNALKIASAMGAASGGGDPYFSNVSLLLHGDGTNGAQNNTFTDYSSNNFTITQTGNAPQGSDTPFVDTSSGSLTTRGTSGYVAVATATALQIPTEDFTIECWFRMTTLPTGTQGRAVFQKGVIASSNAEYLVLAAYDVGGGIARPAIWASTNGTAWTHQIQATSGTVIANTWHHVAYTRSGTSIDIWLDGVNVGSFSTFPATVHTNTSSVGIGSSFNGGSSIGTITNARLVKGSRVYTAGFTPSTTPLTAIAGTSLLAKFDQAAILDSAKETNLATAGNAQISTSVKKFGTGSIVFDGTGDWLVTGNTIPLQLGTGAFTVECWLYLSATGAVRGIVGKGAAATGWLLSVNASNQVVFTDTTTDITSAGTLAGSTWYHIAVVREGTGSNQTKIYINGTNDGTGTSSTDFTQTDSLYVGANRVGADALNGYIDDLRITKGVARYTADFTPPAAAFPDA
jgi:hypothetical protein